MAKCVALFSAGLDSMLAVHMMQQQGIEVHALNFQTAFTCCQDNAAQAALEFAVALTVVTQDDDYFQIVREPSFGYGRAANPCIDCRIYMFTKGRLLMERCGADFVVSGEIVGQKPMGQKRRDLDVIAHHSGLDERLLRPLSALRLPPTLPEIAGLVDRSRLGNFVGSNRGGLIRLAKRCGFNNIPAPSTGCQLTEPQFSRKVFDLLDHESTNERWAFELLRYGRHFRLGSHTKAIVGRQQSDNRLLLRAHKMAPRGVATTIVQPNGFSGPVVLVIGKVDEEALNLAAALVLRYASRNRPDSPRVDVCTRETLKRRDARMLAAVEHLKTIASTPGRC